MIRHSVIFSLNAPIGSVKEAEFLSAAAKLSSIPGVRNFESLRQTSKKNDYDFGLSMEFDTAEDYAAYNIHPHHKAFIQDFWLTTVNKFLEIDFEPIAK